VTVAGAAGSVMTVTGPVTPGELGLTLPHEHVFFDLGTWLLPAPAHKRVFLGEDTLKTGDFPHNLPRLQGKGVRVTAQMFIDRIEGAVVHLFGVWRAPSAVIDGVDAVAPRKLEAVMYESEKLGREI
jgi:hypothetical protein